jgi:hypothetical protein
VVWRNDVERKAGLLGFQIFTQKFISRCSASSSFRVVNLLYHYYIAALRARAHESVRTGHFSNNENFRTFKI